MPLTLAPVQKPGRKALLSASHPAPGWCSSVILEPWAVQRLRGVAKFSALHMGSAETAPRVGAGGESGEDAESKEGEARRGDLRTGFPCVFLGVMGLRPRVGRFFHRAGCSQDPTSASGDLLVARRKAAAPKCSPLQGAAALPGAKSPVSNNSRARAEAFPSLLPLPSHLFSRNLWNSSR